MTKRLPPLTLQYLNRNLTWVDRLTPFRVLLLVLPRQPNEWSSRHLYATQMLRHWFAVSMSPMGPLCATGMR